MNDWKQNVAVTRDKGREYKERIIPENDSRLTMRFLHLKLIFKLPQLAHIELCYL